MDPQRQYAQLLTLWSEGSKLFRRERQYRSRQADSWDGWWRLGRRMVERGLLVLPVPLGSPILLAAVQDLWFTVAGLEDVDVGIARGPVLIRTEGTDWALRWDGVWHVRSDLALSLGQRGWRMLVQWPSPSRKQPWQVADMHQALMVIGAVNRRPEIFRGLDMEDWEVASMLLRHPQKRCRWPHPLPARFGFFYDGQEAWYQG